MLATKPAPNTAIADTEALATLLKAAGDPLRLQILKLLQSNALGVLELTQLFGTTQPAMSHHLKVMSQAGLVEGRREGTSIFYRRRLLANDDPLAAPTKAIYGTADGVQPDADVQTRLQALQRERAERSRQFFSGNARHFRQQQEQIADFDIYAEQTARVLAGAACARGHVLEIGPGNGAFLPRLAALFEQVTGIDNSADMLAEAERGLAQGTDSNVQLRLGECADLIAEGARFDAIIANMVLHHLPAPAELFLQVATLLADNGVFVFTDLCEHEQAWTAKACGDLWQGFSDTEILVWAKRAALQPTANQVLALKNGFQIQSWCLQKKASASIHS